MRRTILITLDLLLLPVLYQYFQPHPCKYSQYAHPLVDINRVVELVDGEKYCEEFPRYANCNPHKRSEVLHNFEYHDLTQRRTRAEYYNIESELRRQGYQSDRFEQLTICDIAAYTVAVQGSSNEIQEEVAHLRRGDEMISDSVMINIDLINIIINNNKLNKWLK